MKRILTTVCFLLNLLLITDEGFGQGSISGYVRDSITGESLIGAGVAIVGVSKGTTTNTYGFYSIPVANKNDSVKVSFIGYRTKKVSCASKSIDIFLSPEALSLSEVNISSKKNNRLETEGLGVINISIERLKAVPALFGETDIIKALGLTPGVMVAQEGSSGLLVRGGTPDQNLILLDEAPVYNVSHLFGLASIFNPDAVKNVTLYKSSFPARFGGRLASVIDIATKDGNSFKKKSELTVGMISSRFYTEGPLALKFAKKASYFLAARSSYLNLFTIPSYINYKREKGGVYINYWLYDINAKVNLELKNRATLFVSFYSGLDKYRVALAIDTGFDDNVRVSWRNRTATLRYTKPIGQKMFFKFTNLYTNYRYSINTTSIPPDNDNVIFLDSKSTITDFTSKASIEFFPNSQHEIRVGLDATRHQYLPSSIKTSYQFDNSITNTTYVANEFSVFAEDDWQINKFIKTNIGFRAVNFSIQKTNYQSFEPRVATNFLLPNEFSLKIGYAKQKQFLHQLVSNTIGLPNDVWVPTTKNVVPQQSNQIAVGVSKTINDKYEVSMEVYQRNMKNLIDTKTGENFLTSLGTSWENTIEKNGIGKARGFEVLVNKTTGVLTGWVSYTLARSQRKFENINQGEWFDFYFDRRHSLAITTNFKTPRKGYSVSSSWIFQTGSPITVPVASYFTEFRTGYFTYEGIYGDRNNYRLPNYHRLDVSLNRTRFTKKGLKKQLTFGLYNAYSRANPFYMSIIAGPVQDGKFPAFDDPTIGYKLNLVKNAFLPILPFISYSREF